jgi:hypothetical protein
LISTVDALEMKFDMIVSGLSVLSVSVYQKKNFKRKIGAEVFFIILMPDVQKVSMSQFHEKRWQNHFHFGADFQR